MGLGVFMLVATNARTRLTLSFWKEAQVCLRECADFWQLLSVHSYRLNEQVEEAFWKEARFFQGLQRKQRYEDSSSLPPLLRWRYPL